MENPPHPFEAHCLSLAKIAAMIGTKQVNLIMRKEPMVLNARRYAFLNLEATLNGQVHDHVASSMPTHYVHIAKVEPKTRPLILGAETFEGKEGDILSG